ncbi:hypothetical protein AJ87_32835 [Rhizobium yanglingense]|nr:hypothetical protein AJ87_32835 [Rhizobium yanglingense]
MAVLPDEELKNRITQIEGEAPDRLKLAEARRLFAKALETPGGLKIQTIHAFCEALLHQFPLEANVAGHFSVLDDRAAATLLADARRSLLTATTPEQDPDLADAFSYILNLGDETGLETLLGEIVASRNAIRRFISAAEQRGGIATTLRRQLQLSADETEAQITSRYWPLPGLFGLTFDLYLTLTAQKGGAKAQEVAYGLRLASNERNATKRAELLEKIFLTAKGEPKSDSQFTVKAMLSDAPELADAIAEARAHIVACRDRLKIMRMFNATHAAIILADRLNRDYDELKKQRSQLDFEDLITRTADLLTKSGVGPWIHYKLDQGIDHILVMKRRIRAQSNGADPVAGGRFLFRRKCAAARADAVCRRRREAIDLFLPGRAPGTFLRGERTYKEAGLGKRSNVFVGASAPFLSLDIRRSRCGRPYLHIIRKRARPQRRRRTGRSPL